MADKPRAGGATGSRARLAMPLAALLLVSAGINLLALAAPIYSMQVFDRVLRTGHGETLLLLSLILAAALAAYALLDALRGGQAARLGHLCESLLGAARLRQGGAGGGSAAGWPAVRAALGPTTLTRLADAPWLLVFLVALWAIHPLLALLALCTVVLLAGLIVLEGRTGSGRLEGRGSEGLLSALQAMPALAGQGAMAVRALARYGRLRAEEVEGGTGRLALGQSLRGGATLVRMLAQSGSLGLAAWLTIQDQVTAGAIIAATILMGRCLSLTEQGLRAALTLRAAAPELRRLREPEIRSLDTETAGGAAAALPPMDRFAALTLDNAVLRDPLAARGRTLRLHASLPMGAIVHVGGPVGSGKSAVCRILAGLQKPDGGAVRLGGLTAEAAARLPLGGIAFAPQRPQFLPGPLLWSLAGEDAEARGLAEAAAQQIGLADYVRCLPQGWETEIDSQGGPLPDGIARLAGLVRAVAAQPLLLVADEPCAALDPGTAARVAELLRPRNGSHVLVFAAADPASVPLEATAEVRLLRDRAQVEMRGASRIADRGQGAGASNRKPAKPAPPEVAATRIAAE